MSNFANFTEDYFEKLRHALTLVPLKQLENLQVKLARFGTMEQLYIFGNGGSAGNAHIWQMIICMESERRKRQV